MARFTTLPRSRSGLGAEAGSAGRVRPRGGVLGRLAAALLPLLLGGWLHVECDTLSWSPSIQLPLLLVEFDELRDYEPVLSAGGATLGGAFSKAGILVMIDEQPFSYTRLTVPRGRPSVPDPNTLALDSLRLGGPACDVLRDTNLPNAYEEICFERGEIAGLVDSTQDMKGGTSFWSLYGFWYAHGLALPCCWDKSGGSCNYKGEIWLESSPLGHLGGLAAIECGNRCREDFVVHYCAHTSDGDRLATAIHELGHVLNLHHAEIACDSVCRADDCPGTTWAFGAWALEHVGSHSRVEVRPGWHGSDWCDVDPNAHERKMHGTTASACGDLCSTRALAEAGSAPSWLNLVVVPEKDSYIPGEPVRVRVVVNVDPNGEGIVEYLSERSLDPALGYLKLWTGSSPDPNDLQSDSIPFLADEAGLKSTPLTASVSVTGIDLDVPAAPQGVALHDGGAAAAPGIHVMASLTGMTARSAPPGLAAVPPAPYSVAARSAPVEVSIAPMPFAPAFTPDAYAPDAYALITEPESRRFLRFLGGDHLERGKRNLEEIARQHPGSMYAPYANLALGVNLSYPFRRFDRDQGVLVRREADHVAAIHFLDAARDRLSDLPLSYRLVLLRTRARTYRTLARSAAAQDPKTARYQYETARRDLEEIEAQLTGLPWPLSLNERDARASALAQLAQIDAEMAAIPGYSQGP